ncbi:hypothetical protein BH23ACT5_BH23ACT5_20210 [soil metagenome]
MTQFAPPPRAEVVSKDHNRWAIYGLGMTTAHSEWVIRPPAAALSPYIDSYIGYRLTGFLRVSIVGFHRAA